KFNETVDGILIDTDEQHVYLQNNISNVVIVPVINIKYYTSDSINVNVPKDNKLEEELDTINVLVDDELVSNIPVQSDLDISACNNRLLEFVWSDSAVKLALRGRVQKTLEYDIGEINIYTKEILDENSQENTFNMNNSGANQLNPFDLVKSGI